MRVPLICAVGLVRRVGRLCCLAVLALLGLRCMMTLAQADTNLVAPTASALSSGAFKQRTPPPPAPIPQPPSFKSPVAQFRELLAMSVAERTSFLADRPPESRKQILAKVREYQSLRPDQRELRLRVTELRWYLWPLMNTAPTNRPAQLDRVPAEDRKLVQERLKAWDKLPETVQKQLLDNEATIRYFTELEDGKSSSNLSPERKAKLEAGIRQWQSLTEEQRQTMAGRFNQFFGLDSHEKERALKTISEPERKQIERTLDSFGKLPPAQRLQCMHSFEKFAGLSLEERQQFLKNAERWKLMTPDERQAWRELVNKISLIPPNLNPPPMPPRQSRPVLAPTVATNGG